MDSLSKKSTGGRGNEKIKECANSLLNRYKSYVGTFSPPIQPQVLAKLQNAKVIYRKGSDQWVSSLMPMGKGFVINVNKVLSMARKRNAICHEIAHTFFFDIESEPPRRLKTHRPDDKEERLCFWAAREMLVPTSLFKKELNTLGCETLYSFEGISRLAKIFSVSPDIIALRLTHDLALLENDWIVLWYSNDKKDIRLRPMSLYPKHISDSISDYMKHKIRENLRILLELKERENAGEVVVGKRKKLRLRVKTEKVEREQLRAISWVSPLSDFK